MWGFLLEEAAKTAEMEKSMRTAEFTCFAIIHGMKWIWLANSGASQPRGESVWLHV